MVSLLAKDIMNPDVLTVGMDWSIRQLADFFIEKLGDEMISDEWQTHLDTLTDYWASITLGDKAYSGQPVKLHIDLEGLERETFERWLKLFSETVDKFYSKEIADIFKSRAQVIANSFMRLLDI